MRAVWGLRRMQVTGLTKLLEGQKSDAAGAGGGGGAAGRKENRRETWCPGASGGADAGPLPPPLSLL